MRAIVKVLMIAEMEVEGEDLEATAQAKLDHFRDMVLPEQNFGITLYRADPDGNTRDDREVRLYGIEVLKMEGGNER